MRSTELTNLNNPIVRAVWPLRQAAADRAETEIKAMMDKILADLEANGWDQDKVAPYPNNCWDRNYKPMVAKYHLLAKALKSLTIASSGSCARRRDTRRLSMPILTAIMCGASRSFPSFMTTVGQKSGRRRTSSTIPSLVNRSISGQQGK
jgi:hypothetical protein